MNTDAPGSPDRPLPPSAPHGDPWILYRLSWGSIIAGAFVAAAVHILLVIMEASFGLAVAPVARPELAARFTVVAGLAGVINAFVSLWLGGWIAGRTAGHGHGNVGGLHGIVVWAVATAAAFALHLRSGNPGTDEALDGRPALLLAAAASWGFLAIAVGAFAAGWGGRQGAQRGVTLLRKT